jgi:hypothetical protein
MTLRSAGLALSALLLPMTAQAATCLVDAPQRDNLPTPERRGGISLLASSMQAEGATVQIGNQGTVCEETWQVVHVKLGRSVTVSASSSSGPSLSMTAQVVEDLPRVYSQLAKSMVSGAPLEEAVARDNVTVAQAQGRRAKTDYMATLMFGATAHPAIAAAPSPTLAGGFRVEVDQWALDVNGRLVIPMDTSAAYYAVDGHISALRFHQPQANHTLYYGGGLGFGAMGWQDGSDGGDGAGFELRGSAGYEMFRVTTMRMFFQADMIAPLYDIGADSWAPTVSFSVGIGYKPQPHHGGSVPWWTLFL